MSENMLGTVQTDLIGNSLGNNVAYAFVMGADGQRQALSYKDALDTSGNLMAGAIKNPDYGKEFNTTFGLSDSSIDAVTGLGSLAMDVLNYGQNKKMNKETLSTMQQNRNIQADEKAALDSYRNAYKLGGPTNANATAQTAAKAANPYLVKQ